MRSQPPATRAHYLGRLNDLEQAALAYEWAFWARPSQLAPAGAWRYWVLVGGRGAGKTRTGAEWVRAQVEAGRCRRVALVSDTAADVRDVMIEGPSGLLAVCPPWDRPTYEPSKRRVTWRNGAQAIAYAAEAPELLRGPQFDGAWCDELAKWANLRQRDTEGGTAWDNLKLALRIGDNPQGIVTTTPRAIPELRALLASPVAVITRDSSYANRDNLSDAWFRDVVGVYEGTRLGRQEIYAELLEDIEGALWRRAWLDRDRVAKAPPLVRVVVAIDPAVTAEATSHETGLVVAGVDRDGQGYVLADRSGRYSPDAWARQAVALYHEFKADRLVAERNNGGDMVAHTLRTVERDVPITLVLASRGKATRAEPVAALFEQGRVHLVGSFPGLEDQLCSWDPSSADAGPNDRLDALVWACTDLLIGRPRAVTAGDLFGGGGPR